MNIFKEIFPALLVAGLIVGYPVGPRPPCIFTSLADTIPPQDNLLPIKLISFSGKPIKDIISFNWSTMQEKNVNHFELEKSVDGITYTTINKQVAKGINSTTENYKAEDFKPNSGDNFYRLKVVTNDGKISYSKTIRIKF